MQKSKSKKMPADRAFEALGLPKTATTEEINQTFKTKLSELQTKYREQPERLVQEADSLYSAYRAAYMSVENADVEKMLPLTITGPDTILNMFGITDLPHQSLKVQMQSETKYKDGHLVKKASNKTESFVNKDGRRETKVYQDGKLIKHTIDGVDQLGK